MEKIALWYKQLYFYFFLVKLLIEEVFFLLEQVVNELESPTRKNFNWDTTSTIFFSVETGFKIEVSSRTDSTYG